MIRGISRVFIQSLRCFSTPNQPQAAVQPIQTPTPQAGSNKIPPLKVYYPSTEKGKKGVLPQNYTNPIVSFPQIEKAMAPPPMFHKAKKTKITYSPHKLNSSAYCVINVC